MRTVFLHTICSGVRPSGFIALMLMPAVMSNFKVSTLEVLAVRWASVEPA